MGVTATQYKEIVLYCPFMHICKGSALQCFHFIGSIHVHVHVICHAAYMVTGGLTAILIFLLILINLYLIMYWLINYCLINYWLINY